MIRYVVIAMGAALCVVGAAAAWTGYDIVQVERGWTQVIAGSVAFTGGVVTIAIGLLLGAVDSLAEAIFLSRMPGPTRQQSEFPVPAPPRAPAAAAEEAPAMPLPPPEPGYFGPPPPPRQSFWARRPGEGITAPAPSPPTERPPAPAPAAASGLSAGAIDKIEEDPALDWLRAAPRPTRKRDEADKPADKPAAAPGASILRRYEANGVTYTLYADGSIDAESADGRFHFADMTELKTHLAKHEAPRDAARA